MWYYNLKCRFDCGKRESADGSQQAGRRPQTRSSLQQAFQFRRYLRFFYDAEPALYDLAIGIDQDVL